MIDKLKLIFAVLFLFGSLFLPLAGLFYGWWNWSILSGFVLMVGTFLVMICFSGLLLLGIKDLSWVTVYLPYIFGAVYGFLPDSFISSVDDAAATSAGAILSYALALRKKPDIPKWIILPLIAAGLYSILGGYIPGPVDEFIIDGLALIVAWAGTRNKQKSLFH